MTNVTSADNALPHDEPAARLAMLTAHQGALWPVPSPAIQRFDDLYDSTPSATLTLDTALEQIVDGRYRTNIEDCRSRRLTQGEDAYKAAKNALPQWTFAGTFAPTRTKDHLTQHSGIAHADIDHLAALAATKLALMRDPCVVYCFTSPRGDGLKYGVRIPVVDSDDAYKHAWGVLAAAHLSAYGVTWDPSGKDICRLCFVSWDPACYIHLDAEMAAIPPPVMVTPPPPPPHRPTPTTSTNPDRREQYAQRAIATAVGIIEASTDGNLHEARRRASYLLGGYVGGGILSYGEAYGALRAAVEGRTKHLTAALRTITSGLAKGEAKPITEAELDAEWEQWRAAHPPVPWPPSHARTLTGPRTITTPITGRPVITAPLIGRSLAPLTLGEQSL
jgi:hypothetical protein